MISIVIVTVAYFAILQFNLQEQSLSKQCVIPHDANFLERKAHTTPNDGKPHYSIEEKFSIYNTVPISSLEIDEFSKSLIIEIMPYSHGYIVMCNPFPVLQKELSTDMNGMSILVDGKETKYTIVDNVLKLNVDNNTRFDIIVGNQ